jgi:predicted ATPase/DNA-binding winged helix-turn-helix (wHTH) protein
MDAAWRPRQLSLRARESGVGKFLRSVSPGAMDGDPRDLQVDPPAFEAAPIDAAGPRAILFGRFCLLLRRRELLADGVPVRLGNRALDVLIALIEARGELVTKDELLSRVWPSTTVEENNLQFQISTLRKALGKDRDLIQTDSGRGYRFIAAVSMGLALPAGERRADFDHRAASVAQLRGPLNNLPARASGLVGRETDLSDVADLVSANRLVTLVGTGGVGKTQLGIELARRVLPKFADGVWLAELGGLSDPGLVSLAIATAVGLSEVGQSPERLAAALSSKRLLLVLDNCEHVIGAAASIAETFLHASASLQVIATSREPLRAEGEWVYRVLPLDVPPDSFNGIEGVLQHSSAELFFARACAAEPGMQLDARTAEATAKICRRLDGIPLAIELAATSAAALGAETLASRLDERFSLLTDGRRAAPARHQTLRAMVDWSYELLSEPERTVIRRLSILGGPFTMAAAGAVAASAEISPADVVRCLASLTAKSLVASNVDSPIPRYRLLETTRAYAMDKLRESGELVAITRRLDAFGTDCNEEPDSTDEVAIVHPAA